MSALWPWAVQAYGREGAEALFLELQDSQGQSVCYLLWAAWMTADGRGAVHGLLIEGAGIARAWEAEIIHPLRQVRRRLKAADAEALYDQVKAAEFDAERALMATLEALAPRPTGSPGDMASALAAASRAWSPPASAEALALLAAVLS